MPYAAGLPLVLKTGIDHPTLNVVITMLAVLAFSSTLINSRNLMVCAMLLPLQLLATFATWKMLRTIPRRWITLKHSEAICWSWRTQALAVFHVYGEGEETTHVVMRKHQPPGTWRRLQWRLRHPVSGNQSNSQ